MRLKRIVFAAMCMALFVAEASARTVVVKLATVVPKDSTWYEYLTEIDEKWTEASDGKVRLKIYAGTLGDESDIMRRIRIGQLDAATVSTVGLSIVDPSAKALHIPLAFASYEELDYVQAGLAKTMEKALREKGFVVLNWGDAGWVHFFTKSPVQRPDDLKKQKLFVWAAAETTETEELWKKLGFKPVPLASHDILPALQTGMITAYQAPPLAALANQWFAFTGSMTDMRWAPLTGGTVISTRAWSKIPSDLRPKLAQIAREAGLRLRDRVRQLEQDAIRAMVKRGLQVVSVPPDAYEEWQELTTSVYPDIRGKIVPAGSFDEVLRLRDEFRAKRLGATKSSN
ncbi:MAG: TRAP transporter substrate-binding protein DctP [Acidiferrobacterales bacterium]